MLKQIYEGPILVLAIIAGLAIIIILIFLIVMWVTKADLNPAEGWGKKKKKKLK